MCGEGRSPSRPQRLGGSCDVSCPGGISMRSTRPHFAKREKWREKGSEKEVRCHTSAWGHAVTEQ